jgi:hypothetical protein
MNNPTSRTPPHAPEGPGLIADLGIKLRISTGNLPVAATAGVSRHVDGTQIE